MMHTHGKLQHLQRPSQVHIQTTFFRLPIQRRRAVNHRIGGVDQSIVIVPAKTESCPGQIPTKDPDARLQIFVETREVQMQLQRLPQPNFGLVRVARAHQQIQRRPVFFQ